MKVVVQRYTGSTALAREVQDFRVFRLIQPFFDYMKNVPALGTQQDGRTRRQALVEQDSLHAT
jgi:hypothetical protein